LATTAKLPHAWEYRHDTVGWNYRMPNINAALGCAQLEQLASFLDAKRDLTTRYLNAFSGLQYARIVTEPPGSRSNYWLQTLLLTSGSKDRRDAILTATHSAGYKTRPVWDLLHTLPHFDSMPRARTPVAEHLAACLVNLPSSAHLASRAQQAQQP
jgi:perosamine synthetase